jgi:nucleoside-diphosphate-sugar epimerase
VGRIVAQSYACHRYARVGGMVKTEDDPLDPTPPAAMRQTVAAMAHLDHAVTGAGGIALRYGNFYGDPGDGWPALMRARKFPVVGGGGGVWSHIHLHDVATATALAAEHGGPAVYNITDDEPAPSGVWLPELAKIVGAKPPQRFPRPLARLFAGEAPVIMATESRGADNARAKAELGWTLRYPSWRQGFAAAYGPPERPAAAT